MAANKGEAEPERKETRVKVDEDRKHEYPFEINTANYLVIEEKGHRAVTDLFNCFKLLKILV